MHGRAHAGAPHGAEESDGVVEGGVLGVAPEQGVVELVGLVLNGAEDKGGIVEVTEAGEEGYELGLEDVLKVESALDDLGEEQADLAAVGAEIEKDIGRVGEEARGEMGRGVGGVGKSRSSSSRERAQRRQHLYWFRESSRGSG